MKCSIRYCKIIWEKVEEGMNLSREKHKELYESAFYFMLFFFSEYISHYSFFFIFKLYIIVLVLPNIKMNPPQVYMCSPS